MSLSLLLAAGLLLLALLLRGARPDSPARWFVWPCLLAAPLLLTLAVGGAKTQNQLQIELTGVEMHRAPQDVTLLMGGDAIQDDIVLRGAPTNLVSVTLPGESDAPARIAVAPHPIDSDSASVVRLSGPSSAGGTPMLDLRPNDLICLDACNAGQDAEWLRFRSDNRFEAGRLVGGRFTCIQGCGAGPGFWSSLSGKTAGASDLFPEMPKRKFGFWFLSFSGMAHWSANQRIYPLRDFGRNGRVSLRDDPCETRFLCIGGPEARRPVASFVHRVGGPWFIPGSGDYRIVLLDPNAEVRRDGKALEPQSSSMAAPSGEAIRLETRTVRYLSPDFAPRGDEGRAPRLGVAETFVVIASDNGLSLHFAEPRRAVARDPGHNAEFDIRGAPQADAPVALRSTVVIVFPTIGRSLAAAMRSRITREDSGGLTLLGVQGRQPIRPHQTIHLGVHGDEDRADRYAPTPAAATAKVSEIGRPWPFVILAVAVAALLALTLRDRLARAPLVAAVLGVLQLLLALRWLIGWAGAHLDPALGLHALSATNTAQYLCLPALFLWGWTLLPSGVDSAARKATAPVLIFATVGSIPPLLLSVHIDDLARVLIVLCGVLAMHEVIRAALGQGLPMILWNEIRKRTRNRLPKDSPAPPADAKPSRLRRLRGRLDRIWAKAQDELPIEPLPLALLALAVLLRLGVMVVGVKERFSWPFPLAVSALYLPPLLILMAIILTKPRTVGAAVIFLFAWLVSLGAPFALADKGFALVYGPVLAFAAFYLQALPAFREKQPGKAAAWSVTALISLLLLVGPLVTLHLSDPNPATAWAANAPRAEVIAQLNDLAEKSGDDVRSDRFLDPAKVVGTRAAEASHIWASQLDAFTAEPTGQGYGQPADLGDLRPVQIDDNLSAVHVMAPFGRLGAAALIALLASLAWLSAVLTRPRPGSARLWMRIAALMGLWTVAGAAAYMVLANLRLVLFTGRNIYLLAASSSSDLLEGGVILLGSALLLAVWNAIYNPRSEGASS